MFKSESYAFTLAFDSVNILHMKKFPWIQAKCRGVLPADDVAFTSAPLANNS